jgi:hypothetical protein
LPRISTNTAAKNKEYIDSGRWKCDESPSGAHHWIIIHDQMTCKHCAENRKVLDYTGSIQLSLVQREHKA